MFVFDYLRAHWQGELSLTTSLWINLLALLLVVSWLELQLLSQLTLYPSRLVWFTLASLFMTRVIVYAWQLVGYIRAVDADYARQGYILKTRALQGLAVVTLAFNLFYSLEVLQGAIYYQAQVTFYSRPAEPDRYQLVFNQKQEQLTIQGDFEVGITAAVREQLRTTPNIRSVVLNSRGGQVYEGRGLARLFRTFALDTYVYGECSSACATAFVGGRTRYLGKQGKLGFHQFWVETRGNQSLIGFYDTAAEQTRDAEVFRTSGVSERFLDRMFDQPANRIWFPDHRTLLEARVVHVLTGSNG